MDEFLEVVYLQQAKLECEACFAAINALNASLRHNEPTDPFVHAMTLVHRAAAVSRIFWPPGGRDKHARQRAQRRGEALRKSLSIPVTHPVQTRTLRDHFEHFDERLDDWAEHSKNRVLIGKFLGPRQAIAGKAVLDEDIIHHYDPATNVYAFRGERFDIQALAAGLEDLYAKVSLRLSELDRWRLQRR